MRRANVVRTIRIERIAAFDGVFGATLGSAGVRGILTSERRTLGPRRTTF
jgi:hypothetical protein